MRNGAWRDLKSAALLSQRPDAPFGGIDDIHCSQIKSCPGNLVAYARTAVFGGLSLLVLRNMQALKNRVGHFFRLSRTTEIL